MKVGILGSGTVGTTLAGGFKKHGHEVMIGTRNPDEHTGTVSLEKAAKHGNLLVLAVKGAAAEDALTAAGNIDGKIIIDATNPIDDRQPDNGVLRFFTSLDESLMERLQSAHPNARFVKAFNSIGAGHMVNPTFKERPTMFICGNDAVAKADVSRILEQFGFEPEDMGGVEAARAIEPLCMLWCIPGFLRNEWTHAFRLLH